jgi:hypothetical protein
MREAWAYITGSSTTCSNAGRRITLRDRSAFFTRRTKRTTDSAGAVAPAGVAARVPPLSSIA